MTRFIIGGVHYLASNSTVDENVKDLFHDSHLELQEWMGNPIAFHAKVMGDIMHVQQALSQPDAKEFVCAII